MLAVEQYPDSIPWGNMTRAAADTTTERGPNCPDTDAELAANREPRRPTLLGAAKITRPDRPFCAIAHGLTYSNN
jgi:hypothetical protein